MPDFIQAFDFSVLDFIQQNMRCGALDVVFTIITYLGSGGILWIAAAVCMLFTKKYRRCGIAVLVCLLLGLFFGNLILKHIVARARPCWLKPISGMLVAVPTDFSFPSGHTLSSFIVAIVIFRHSWRLGIPAMVVAALIAFSRLYVYVHFPTDLLGAMILAVPLAIFGDILTQRVVSAISRRWESRLNSQNPTMKP